HSRRLLERSRRDKRVSRKRSLRDTQQQRLSLRDFAVDAADTIVLVLEAEPIDLLFEQEFGVADFLDLHPAEHLTNNHLNVLVVDVHALQTIDLLNFVYEVFLQAVHTQDSKNVVRVQRTIHQSLTGSNAIAFLHVDVRTAGDIVLALFAVVADDDEFPFALGNRTELNDSVDFRHDRRLAGTTSFEQFHYARQTARDVLGLGRLARNLCNDVTRLDFFAVVHH